MDHGRLVTKQRVDQRLWRRHLATLDAWFAENPSATSSLIVRMRSHRDHAAGELDRIIAPEYGRSLQGTLGVPAANSSRTC
jgi:hypothetical protein